MASARGRSEVKRYIASLPGQIETKLLRGAARAAANVIRDEAQAECIDDEVAAALKVRTKVQPGLITARIKIDRRMPGSSRALWIEYGTDPHLISVSDQDRGGMSVGRINQLNKEGSLVIGGHFVGPVVEHPGAKAHPFLRTALDRKEVDAIAAAQSYINARVSRGGITGAAEPEGEE